MSTRAAAALFAMEHGLATLGELPIARQTRPLVASSPGDSKEAAMSGGASGPCERERVETIVIGGGQAGLAVGYHLAQRDLPFVILDANERIGDAWRKRWDSLRLFTPARYNALPGMAFPGPAQSFSTKDEVADYLEAYAARFDAPGSNRHQSRSAVQERQPFRRRSGRPVLRRLRTWWSRWQAIRSPESPSFAHELDPGIVPAPFQRVPEPLAAPRRAGTRRRSRELRRRDRDRGGEGAPERGSRGRRAVMSPSASRARRHGSSSCR